MASLDVRRPAAMEQLAVLGRETQINTLPIVEGQSPGQIARRAVEAAKLGAYDVVLLDTAGRTTLDDAMMSEATEVKHAVNPHEVLLVADALTGQDAVNLARSFDERVGLTGIVLTRVDGDGRGGAALSMRAVIGKPIKLIGTGEKLDALEEISLPWSKRPLPISMPKRRCAPPRKCARARSISAICASSSHRCRGWAALAGS
jgi:signal recognition particle subunit SRP54